MTEYRIVALIVAAVFGTGLATVSAQDSAPTAVELKNHIQLGMPEQDAFIEFDEDSTMVVRVEGDEAADPNNLAMAVYGTAEMVEHDAFKLGENPLGPFPKGAALGFTLADWLAGTGSGTYAVDGDTATLELELTSLVPDGLYTVWCSQMTLPPNPAVADFPCGAEDGSENQFTADSSGSASFSVEMKPLEASTDETASVIALAYHSDGKTYGESPGPFGQATHVQLAWMAPVPESSSGAASAQAAEQASEQASEQAPETLPKTGAGDSAMVLMLVGLVLAAVGAVGLRRRRAATSPDISGSDM